jgi:hypothetical protein
MFVGEYQMQDLNEYYRRVFKISNYIIELYNSRPDECSIHTRIHDAVEFGPNFFYGVTPNDGSLLLNISYFTPSDFYTPLGRLNFAGGGCGTRKIFEEYLEIIKLKLGLVEIIPKTSSLWGEFGPIFAVTQDLDGCPFHLTDMPLAKAEISHEYNREEWRKIKANLLEQEEKQDESTSSMQP